MNIEDLLYQTRNSIDPIDAYWCLVSIAATVKSGRPVNEARLDKIEDRSILPALEWSARDLLAADRQDRYRALTSYLEDRDQWRSDTFCLRPEATEQIVDMIDGAMSVRFSGLGFQPCLFYAFEMSQSGQALEIFYAWIDADACRFMEDLAVVLDLDDIIRVEHGWPWCRDGKPRAEIEVMLPPFGHQVRQIDDIPTSTLSLLGAHEGRLPRLTGEGLAIADALRHVEGRVILCVSEGALFRMVGSEPVARDALIESDRLQAVLGIPQSMVFTNTPIKCGLILMTPRSAPSDMVRFVDLGHETLSQKGRRGRTEILDGVLWRELLSGPEPADRTLSRDVSHQEIADNNNALVPDRYLNIGIREKIETLLSQTNVAELSELMELVRPVTIPADEGGSGEYTLYEASPLDVNPRGFLSEPKRAITVDRAKYSRALNQQLRPGDLLLSIKGTIGVVAIVPDHAPGTGENEIWTAGQSMMILRPKKRVSMSVIALYEYLTNEIVHEYVKSLAGGMAIQTLAMKDLKEIEVPLPDEETIRAVEENFAAREAIFDQIDALHAKLGEVRAKCWPHSALSAESQ